MIQEQRHIQPDGPTVDPLRTRMPVLVERAHIVSVDPVRYQARVRTEFMGRNLTVPWMSDYVNVPNGEGTWAIPEPGAVCYIVRPTDLSPPFILGFLGHPSAEDGYRSGRPAGTPGDWFARTRDGNYLSARRGGVIEVRSTPLCQSLYLPIQNTVRHIFENSVSQWPGGQAQYRTLRDRGHPTGQTPTYYEFRLKEFTEGLENFVLRVGRIPEEDDRTIEGGDTGAILLTLNANEHFELALDRDGNLEWVQRGHFYQKVGGDYLLRVDGNFDISVGQGFHLRWGGDQIQDVQGSVQQSISGRNVRLVEAGEEVEVRGTRRVVANRVEEEVGSQKVVVSGDLEQEILGNELTTAAAGSIRTIGGPAAETVLGAAARTVLHAEDPTKLLQDELADLVRVMDGLRRVVTDMGSQEWVIGPERAPFCTLRLHGDPRRPARLGRLTLDLHTSGARVLFDASTGTLELTNRLGAVRLGMDGRVAVGQNGAPMGHIVTTTTHPVDYFTGAPILGCAGAMAAGVPVVGPGLPSPPVPDP